ncbi:MAG: type IV pilin protein [Xenococcaceae cyanobacterium]
MNRVFTAKLLQQLNNKKNKKNKGFTLIELLVVVIIIGVLAAVALPNLLSQVGKARETEGKNGVGTINRTQQSYHFEKQGFASLDNTGLTNAQNQLGVVINSKYYTFGTTGNNVTSYAVHNAVARNGQNDGVRQFNGAIAYNNGSYATAICQSNVVNGPATLGALGVTAADNVTTLSSRDTACDTTASTALQ